MEVADLVLPVFAVIVTGWHFWNGASCWRSRTCVSLRARVPGRSLATRPAQQHDAWHDRSHDQYWFCSLGRSCTPSMANAPSLRSNRNFVRGCRDVPGYCHPIGNQRRGSEGSSVGAALLTKQIIRWCYQLCSGWSGPSSPAASDVSGLVSEYFSGRIDAARALRNRAWFVSPPSALQPRSGSRFGVLEAVRPVHGLGSQPTLHDCRGRLRGRAHSEDRVHHCSGVKRLRAAGRRHCANHDIAVGCYSIGMALRSFELVAIRWLSCRAPGRDVDIVGMHSTNSFHSL